TLYMCIIDCLSTIVFILPLHLDYTKVIILILWWRNFQLEYWRTFQLVSTLEALAKAGEYEKAIDIIKTFWGAMLDLGATTFWEDFNLDWIPNAAPIDEPVPAGKKDIHGDFGAYCYPGFRHSLCHGWSSGPTTWLSDHVLGIKIVDVERKQISIEPHLGKLEWAKGTYPTPWGVIEVSHEKKADGKIATKVKLPKGVRQI
ncbi:alpha-L-rhamnosidase C-terminal domain-containing protein, partial [Phocaeicola vulgatus]|uniref:alpha-L-rhamnosidase C-terminal domain-containing protein n=1 Tax=Phocaeicola vulgatus TaxID=821 RepID=UPI00293E5660